MLYNLPYNIIIVSDYQHLHNTSELLLIIQLKVTV